MNSKSKLRQAWRKSYPRDPEFRRMASEAICRTVRSRPEFLKAPQVSLFAGLAWEVELRSLWEMRPKACVYPKVIGERLHFFYLESWTDLKTGYWGILEPPDNARPANPWGPKDLLLVPGSVFDKRGGRIGGGKGFYDRFLENHPSQKWGVAYSQQILDGELAQEPWDVRMDAIISELGLAPVAKH